MKHQFLPLCCGALLLLASCGPKTSAEHPSQDSLLSGDSSLDSSLSEGSFSDPYKVDYSKQDVYDALEKISNGLNYTLEFEMGDQYYQEIHTVDYSSSEYTGMGYIALPSYDGQGRVFYKYVTNNADGSPDIKQALAYQPEAGGDYVPVKTAEEADPIALLISDLSSFGIDDIEEAQKCYVTSSRDAITVFASMMGVSDYQDLIAKITFQLEKEGLRFTFYPTFGEGYEVVDGITGLFHHIGTSVEPALEAFLESFSWNEPSGNLVSSAVNNNSFTVKGVVSRTYIGKETLLLEESRLLRGAESTLIEKRYAGTSSWEKRLIEKGENGDALWSYVNPQNEVTRVSLGQSYDDYLKNPVSYFEGDAFRKGEKADGYRYVGYQSRYLVKSLVQYDLGVLESVEVKIKDGKVASLSARTPTYYDSFGNPFYTSANVDFLAFESAPSLSSLPALSETEHIANVLSLFDGSTSFAATSLLNGNLTYAKSYVVKGDIFLEKETGHDTSIGAGGDYVDFYSGFQVTSAGAVPFSVDWTLDEKGNRVQGTAKACKDTLAGVKMNDIIGFVASPNVFYEDASGNIAVRPTVDGLGQGIFGGRFEDYIIPSSFSLSLDAKGQPASLSYEFQMGEGYYVGKEKVLFSSWGTASLPESIDFSSIGVWNAPESWEEELRSDQYQILTDMFGASFMEGLPFLYAPEIEGSWQLTDDTPEGYHRIHIFSFKEDCPEEYTEGFYKTYAESYASYLETLGFVVSSDNAWGLPAYAKGEWHIRITYATDAQIDLFVFDNELQ